MDQTGAPPPKWTDWHACVQLYALRFNGPKTHLRYDEILDIVLLGTRKDDFICAPVSIVGFKSCTKGARECLRPRVGVLRHT